MAIVKNFMIRGRFGYTVRTLESSERYALAVLKLLITGSFLVSCGSAISQASVIMFRVMTFRLVCAAGFGPKKRNTISKSSKSHIIYIMLNKNKPMLSKQILVNLRAIDIAVVLRGFITITSISHAHNNLPSIYPGISRFYSEAINLLISPRTSSKFVSSAICPQSRMCTCALGKSLL